MAIEFEDVKSILYSLRENSNIKYENCLILGNANIYPTFQKIKEFGEKINFKLIDINKQKLSAQEFGKCLGFKCVETLDINDEANIKQDLTKNLRTDLIDKYDLVIDAGVLFYCFEPGIALKNIFLMAKKQSLIVHITAISGFYGRAYYNIHPQVLIDFYKINSGFIINSNIRPRPFKSTILNYFMAFYKKIFFFCNHETFKKINSNDINFIYYNKSTITKIYFSNKNNYTESRNISNNIVGTFSFQIEKNNNNILVPILTF
jgi:hypothetical protein